MRIVQLSDIHLSKENLNALKDYYMESLIQDLQIFHKETPIDLIILTGDLIDKGGESFTNEDPYKIFKDEVIDKITVALTLHEGSVLMIPGNHDVVRSEIYEDNEYFLAGKLTSEFANERSQKFHEVFNNDNKRIQRFKEFEKTFHQNNPNYKFSNNESLYIFEKNTQKIGIALINDSWRCSSALKKEQHFIGNRQLFRARTYFNENETELNIAVFHHPLNSINDIERDEISNILKSKNFDIAFFGHNHRHEADHLISSIGGYLSINGRSAFSEPKEQSSKYQPGYNILDIDINSREYGLNARKFIIQGYRFDKDTDSLQNGYYSNALPQNERLFPLAEDSNNEDKDLPDSYTADVDRIVSLLIGESIYPDKYAFVRELIQNAVDACNRIKEAHSNLTPQIIITIDSQGNFIEVTDQGDGMSKSILKNHFSILGKSISQDFNDNSGGFNLISKFGIGFISTFIVAEKVVINTKSEEDEQIIFEIENVFKGFKYFQPSQKDIKTSTGTTVRVYLKKGYDVNVAYQNIRNYCRHIENLEIDYNNVNLRIDEKWNIEDSVTIYSNKNHLFELKLGLAGNNKNITASYCGFLINNYPHQIIPFMFPSQIGGEINFNPKSIDFDISRTNIIPTEKAEVCRKEISVSLRKLFREALEKRFPIIFEQVVGYLQCYLQHFDGIAAYLDNSYSDFYSKKELISLCAEYSFFKYGLDILPLNQILSNLKTKKIDKFYVQENYVVNDYQAIVIEYLEDKDNLIVLNNNFTVNFHTSQQQYVSITSIIQIIANEYGITMHNINDITPNSLVDMKIDKETFHEKLQFQISSIQTDYFVSIEIGKFSSTAKPSVRYTNHIFLNYNHETFQSLLYKIDEMHEDILRIYLLGLLGLGLTVKN